MKKQSYFHLLKGMLSLIKGKRYLIFLAVIVGTLGFLSAMGITFFGGLAILKLLGIEIYFSWGWLIGLILMCGFSRGFLRYAEQYLNHYMAFTLLALVRNNLFHALREQGNKVLDGPSKGELLSILQSDTESLEVFYAHTITPFFIAILTETVVLVLLGVLIHYSFSLVGLMMYLLIGLATPVIFYLSNRKLGIEYREKLAEAENLYLNCCYGIKETLFFQNEEAQGKELEKSSRELNRLSKSLNNKALASSSIVSCLILLGDLLIILLGGYLFKKGVIASPYIVLGYMMVATSFGPVVALANLPANLTMSFASAKRIIPMIEEKPKLKDGEKDFCFSKLEVSNVKFSYDGKEVLKGVSFSLGKGEIIGIEGKSGCGKSTLFKLLLHFEEPDSGEVSYNGESVSAYSRQAISKNIALFSQSTYLFKKTIRYNLNIAKPGASEEELYKALAKAGLEEKVRSLKSGLDTEINDLGDNLSSGEKQRLGLARIFLADTPVILLDEATSNVDAYNEAYILNQLKKEKGDKAIIIISHRPTSLSICDHIYRMKDGRLC